MILTFHGTGGHTFHYLAIKERECDEGEDSYIEDVGKQ